MDWLVFQTTFGTSKLLAIEGVVGEAETGGINPNPNPS
jgi:hypothetical protein